jgi:ACT domain-containing protein
LVIYRGEILSDSVDIESILTNGIGSYSATIICNGCEYEVEYETIDSESAQTASRSQYYRYRSGKIVNPLHFELDEHENIVDITIAPNPASKSIFIDKIINVTQLTILSTSGTEIMTIDIDNKDSINIDIESLQNGVYLIRCNIPNQTSKTLKFVKL